MACIAVCSAAPALGVTHWTFALDSLPLNVYLTYLAYKFYRDADRDGWSSKPRTVQILDMSSYKGVRVWRTMSVDPWTHCSTCMATYQLKEHSFVPVAS